MGRKESIRLLSGRTVKPVDVVMTVALGMGKAVKGDESRVLLEGEARLNLFGRIVARNQIIRLLMNRLAMERDRRRYPEIAAQEIRRPIFIRFSSCGAVPLPVAMKISWPRNFPASSAPGAISSSGSVPFATKVNASPVISARAVRPTLWM